MPVQDHNHPLTGEDWPDLTQSTTGRLSQRMLRESLDTGVRVTEDGRLDIQFSKPKPWLEKVIRHTQQKPYPTGPVSHKPSVCAPEDEAAQQYPVRFNIVIHVVGSRGDVQPFIAIAKVLVGHGHRVRLATHLAFREFIEKQGLEFFDIGGDPAELMAFMVKNPGLMPDMRTIRSGVLRKRRRDMKAIFSGCWRACYETGDGTGLQHHIRSDPWEETVDYRELPFVADVIIANPPSFAFQACAEKMGVPVNIMFTMPWSPTQAFAHPLANVRSHNTKPSAASFASYAIVEIMMWEGLGDLINRFRKRELGLDPLDAIRAPSMSNRLRIPVTYLWSPALLPKPLDWGPFIDVCGFCTLPGAAEYDPPPELLAFLDAGPPPIYVGFGSIVVDNPAKLTNTVFEAIRLTGQRAIVSKGWGNIGADEDIPDTILMIGKCPHDWLFTHVSCVVHHGGAGTTAAGLLLGRPTVIIPFFGDQPFWGSIVYRAGAGPEPVPYKSLTAEKLADAITEALEMDKLTKAREIGAEMRTEHGARDAVCSFYGHLNLERLRCALCPGRPAVWWVKHEHVRLSAFAATVLVEAGLLRPQNLVLYRSQEYDTNRDPRGPMSAGAEVLYGVVSDFIKGVAEVPTGLSDILNPHNHHHHRHHHRHRRHGGAPHLCPWQEEWRKSAEERAALRDSGVSGVDIQKHLDGEGEGEGEAAHSETSSGLESESESGSESGSSSGSSSDSSSLPYTSAREDQASTQHTHSYSYSHDHSQDQNQNEEESSTRSSSTSTQLNGVSLEQAVCGRPNKTSEMCEVLTDAGYHLAKAGKYLVNWMLMLPTDLTLSLSKGFHNAPKMYRDPMVAETPTVRGVKGGFRAAGTEFTQQFYQGITGIVTQPAHGLKEEGVKGVFKGIDRGIGGLFLKPAAGLWGLAGYPLDGLHKTLRNSLARSKTRDILTSRITQGLGEMVAATTEERAKVIRSWNALQKKTESQS